MHHRPAPGLGRLGHLELRDAEEIVFDEQWSPGLCESAPYKFIPHFAQPEKDSGQKRIH
jgi:hypothetical protein